MLSCSQGFNFFVHASTLQSQLGEHVEDGRPTFAHLNYQVLVTECERMVAILDRAIAERYSSGTVQKQHIESLGLGEDPVRVLEARIADLEMTRIALQEQWGQIASRPLPLQRLLEEIPDAPAASEGFLLALCSVFDPAIRQRLALLRDNILLGHVDVGVILQLFAPSAVARLEGRRFFEPEGSLQKHHLVELSYPKDALATDHLLAREVRIPSRVESFVLGRQALDSRVAPFARVEQPFKSLDDVILAEDTRSELVGLLHHLHRTEQEEEGALSGLVRVGRSLVLHIQGAPGTGKTLLIDALAGQMNRPVITVEATKIAAASSSGLSENLERLFFEARQRGAILAVDGAEALFAEGVGAGTAFMRFFETFDGMVMITSVANLGLAVERWIAYRVKLPIPSPELRERLWHQHLPTDMEWSADVDVTALAHPYELTGGQIRNSILLAMNRAMSQGKHPMLTQGILSRSAQDQLRADVGDLGHKAGVHLAMDSLILPKKETAQIQEILDACRVRTHVLSHWGFGKRITTGRGMVLLFSGEPGTGKTLCAEILSSELEIPMFRVSVPRIMSKWVGETEKNIADVFRKAKGSHSMLLFDEADSLFTNRVKVENSVDRFANMETNLLLQEIERFEGVVVLTTNHEKNMDDAFQRRIQFKVSFPFPEADERARIWKALIPPECPTEDLDFSLLGESYELSGGYIKNAILKAAYRAAIEESSITMGHIEQAAEQECKNAGKIFQSIRSSKVESLF